MQSLLCRHLVICLVLLVLCNAIRFALREKKEFCASCKNLIWSGNPISRRNTSSSQIMKSFHTQIIRPQRRLAKPKPIYIGSPNARKPPGPECGIGHPARRRRRTAVGGSRRRTAIAIYRSRSAGQACTLIAHPNFTLSPLASASIVLCGFLLARTSALVGSYKYWNLERTIEAGNPCNFTTWSMNNWAMVAAV